MFKKISSKICTPDVGLLLLRIGVGVLFIVHGWGKFSHMEQTIGFFNMLGLAPFFAYLVATVELVGGLSVLLGFFSCYSAILLAVVMIVAMLKTPWTNGGEIGIIDAFMKHAYEFILLFASLSISASGSGRYSIKKTGCVCHSSCDCSEDPCIHDSKIATPPQI